MSKLERAKALLDAGALTPEEFEAEKARLLPSWSTADRETADAITHAAEDDETTSRRGWIKGAVAGVLVIAVAIIGWVSFAGNLLEQPTKVAPLPTATPSATPTPAATLAPAPALTAEPPATSSKKAADPGREWTPEQSRLIAAWKADMAACDPAEEESVELTEACERLDRIQAEMKSKGICTAPIAETDAVELRRCR